MWICKRNINQLCTGCYLAHIHPCLFFSTPIIMPTYGAYVHLLDTWSIFPFLPASLLLPYPVFNRGNETFLFLSAFSLSFSLFLSLSPSVFFSYSRHLHGYFRNFRRWILFQLLVSCSAWSPDRIAFIYSGSQRKVTELLPCKFHTYS